MPTLGTPAVDAPPAVSFKTACGFWLKLGFVSFGGPAGQIALMHEELVERRRWISESRFLHALDYCMVLPGPEAQQLATYLGWLMHRTAGGVIAGALFVLPSLVLLIALSWVYMAFGHVPAIAGVFYGIKPAVTAIVVHAAHRIGKRALRGPAAWAIAAASFVAIAWFNVPFPWIVGAAAVAGAVFLRGALRGGVGHLAKKAATHQAPPALIDDATPTPSHARFSRGRLARVCVAFAALWAASFAAIVLVFGTDSVLAAMARFFTQAALVTFGGAYAVLPYVVQGAVDRFHWLDATQMIDGLALGETTPGPLIMVVAFVGYVGGWTHPMLGTPALSGAAAATVATFYTFLPSFFFILVGGPLIESTHGKVAFAAPLSGITAAVVGVIANLAVFFAMHVVWPRGVHGPFAWPTVVLGIGAAIALFRLRANVMLVIGVCGLVGLALGLLGVAL